MDMGRTFVNAAINGTQTSKEYNFLVDTGSTHIGLPMEEIQGLGLRPIRNGVRRFLTATGLVDRQTYAAEGEIEGQGFVATVVPSPRPLIGYELLENMRLRVNPVTPKLERVPEEVEDHPPYLLLMVAG